MAPRSKWSLEQAELTKVMAGMESGATLKWVPTRRGLVRSARNLTIGEEGAYYLGRGNGDVGGGHIAPDVAADLVAEGVLAYVDQTQHRLELAPRPVVKRSRKRTVQKVAPDVAPAEIALQGLSKKII